MIMYRVSKLGKDYIEYVDGKCLWLFTRHEGDAKLWSELRYLKTYLNRYTKDQYADSYYSSLRDSLRIEIINIEPFQQLTLGEFNEL